MSKLSHFLFDGSYREKPGPQFTGSRNVNSREDFVKKVHKDRSQRQIELRQVEAAVKIQAGWRSYRCRREQKTLERCRFDDLWKRENATIALFLQQLKRLLFLYDSKDAADNKRLVLQCQNFVKINRDLLCWLSGLSNQTDEAESTFALGRFLSVCLKYLSEIASSLQPIAMPMRVLELLLLELDRVPDSDTDSIRRHSARLAKLVAIMIRRDGYASLRVLLDAKIPADISVSSRAPVPIARDLLMLISRPFIVANASADHGFICDVYLAFVVNFLVRPLSVPVTNFLLPALLESPDFSREGVLNAVLADESSKATNSASSLRVPPTRQLLYCVLRFFEGYHATDVVDKILPNSWKPSVSAKTPHSDGEKLLLVLSLCFDSLLQDNVRGSNLTDDAHGQAFRDEEDGDREVAFAQADGAPMETDAPVVITDDASLCAFSLSLLNSEQLVNVIWKAVERSRYKTSCIRAACKLCYIHTQMLTRATDLRLLYKFALKPEFLRHVWDDISAMEISSFTGRKRLLRQLQDGFGVSTNDRQLIVPQLSVFCSLFSINLIASYDVEFFDYVNLKQPGSAIPFSNAELAQLCPVLRDIALGLVNFAFPDTTHSNLGENYKDIVTSRSAPDPFETKQWFGLFEATVRVLKLLHDRDVRLKFCEPKSWSCPNQIAILNQKVFRRNRLRQQPQLFGAVRWLTRQELGNDGKERTQIEATKPAGVLSCLMSFSGTCKDEGPPLSSSDMRNLTILRKVPFVVPFDERVKILHSLIEHDRAENGSFGPAGHHHGGFAAAAFNGGIKVSIRRNFIYEDAYDKLSYANEPNLRLPIRVHMLNWAGLDEAGIDGGGIFREFLNELLTTAFDPSRGFFLTTPHEGLLYPNPAVAALFPDTFHHHYYFLGRMLGKMLYENLLAEIPFASFFLSKLLSKRSSDVDIHHLASLDPVLYKNLLFLKQFDGDVLSLHLDFSVVVDELGTIKKHDLKPNGSEIRVDNASKVEYVFLVADFYLNRQIRTQTHYFRQGLSDLIDLDWLGMFDHSELQILLSGANVDIDLDDLRRYTVYSNGYSDVHEVIKYFWEALRKWPNDKRKQLLKFVTSCSRPPLLGFKDLYPPFCVQMVPDATRLPTAATCMNLLKLPTCTSLEAMNEKLLYAIESGTGFELS